ncbi:MAG: hypothetical protein ACLFUE_03885 [Desulfobacteraceae bacterium]
MDQAFPGALLGGDIQGRILQDLNQTAQSRGIKTAVFGVEEIHPLLFHGLGKLIIALNDLGLQSIAKRFLESAHGLPHLLAVIVVGLGLFEELLPALHDLHVYPALAH